MRDCARNSTWRWSSICSTSIAITTFALRDWGNGTAVTWSMTGPVTLVTRIMGIFTSMDRMVGSVFDKGLARLKADVEAA